MTVELAREVPLHHESLGLLDAVKSAEDAALQALVDLGGYELARSRPFVDRELNARLEGRSAALALAVGALLDARGVRLPPTIAFSGVLDDDGATAPVTDLPAKIAAAREAGIRLVYCVEDGPARGRRRERGTSIVPLAPGLQLLDVVEVALADLRRHEPEVLRPLATLPAIRATIARAERLRERTKLAAARDQLRLASQLAELVGVEGEETVPSEDRAEIEEEIALAHARVEGDAG